MCSKYLIVSIYIQGDLLDLETPCTCVVFTVCPFTYRVTFKTLKHPVHV